MNLLLDTYVLIWTLNEDLADSLIPYYEEHCIMRF